MSLLLSHGSSYDLFETNRYYITAFAGIAILGAVGIQQIGALLHRVRLGRWATFLIIGLCCNFGLDGEAFGKKWRLDFEEAFAAELAALAPMQADGIVEVAGPRIRVTPLGRAFIRNVCMTFDRYLESDPAERRYSQTV